jgi:hypothetical protein
VSTRRWHVVSRRLTTTLALVVIGTSFLVTLAPSPVSAASLPLGGVGPSYCANAPEGGAGYRLGASMQTAGGDVFACGPVPIIVNPRVDSGPAIRTFWPITDQGGFQCTELAVRYLYAATDGADFVNENSKPVDKVAIQNYWDGTGKDFAADVGHHFGFAVSSHLNGHASSLPQVGDILSEMTSPGEIAPQVGTDAKMYGDVGVVTAVIPAKLGKPAMIQLMVENNSSTGFNVITEHSATSWSINNSAEYFYYTSFKWFSPVSASHGTAPSPVRPVVLPNPPTHPVTMPNSGHQYVVYGVTSLAERATPSELAKKIGDLPVGNQVEVRCQGAGADVQGSQVWDQLTNFAWIPDYYVDTPNIAVFSYPIPLCVMPRTWTYAVHQTLSLGEHAGPSTSDPSVGSVRGGAFVDVVCQTPGSLVGDSRTWDYLVNNTYVPNFYAGAINDANSGAIPQCPDFTPAKSVSTTTTTVKTTTTTPPSSGVTITAAQGFRFKVRAGAPKKVTEFDNSGQQEVAPPGQDYVKISVSVQNLQTDRGAPLFDLVNGGGGASGDLSVFMGLPTRDAGPSNGACQVSNGVYTAPSGHCVDTQTDVLLSNGDDVNTASELGQNPVVKAGAKVTITLYFGPVPTGFSLSGAVVLFGIGAGPTMATVPIG